MSEGLRHAIARALGDDSGARSFRENLEALVAQEGSGRAAARAIGVDEAQVRRWRAGKQSPSASSSGALERAARAARVNQRDPRAADFKLQVKERQGGPRGRERVLRGDTNLRLKQEGLNRVKDAYVSGDDARAEREFLDAIGETDFYRDFLDPDRTEERWGSDYGAVVLG